MEFRLPMAKLLRQLLDIVQCSNLGTHELTHDNNNNTNNSKNR